MFPKIKEPNPPTSQAIIEDFESTRELTLPSLYKTFLLASNGGRPSPLTFPIEGMALNPLGAVHFFFGIGARLSAYDLASVYDLYAAGLPKSIVPIACTDGDDFVCLDLRDGGERVAFWDRRHFWGTGEWREGDLYHVANSFEEFLASLRPNPH